VVIKERLFVMRTKLLMMLLERNELTKLYSVPTTLSLATFANNIEMIWVVFDPVMHGGNNSCYRWHRSFLWTNYCTFSHFQCRMVTSLASMCSHMQMILCMYVCTCIMSSACVCKIIYAYTHCILHANICYMKHINSSCKTDEIIVTIAILCRLLSS
jgi:hypothetical protein